MKKIAVPTILIVVCFALLCVSPLLADADNARFFSVAVNCGNAESITLQSFWSTDVWHPETTDSLVTITISDGRKTDGIYVAWLTDDADFLIRAADADGKTVKEYRPGDQFDGFGNFYALPQSTKTVQLSFTNLTEKCGIGYVQVKEAGKDDPSIMCWNPPRSGGVDLMIVPTHQDDEHIYLGGVAPYFLDRGYTVSVAYSVRCNRMRYEEALRGLWELGFTEYPDFLGYKDGRKDTYQDVIDFWGGDENAILTDFVRLIRKNRPEVIVSHDEVSGETNHKQHIATAKLLARAFEKAADPEFDPESVRTYGVWQAKKYYEHLWTENVIQLDFTKKLQRYGGLTPLEVAAAGYEYHETQHEFYHVFAGGKNDTSLYGLRLSSVGYDDIDMFYNVKGTKFTKKAIRTTTASTAVTVPEVDRILRAGGVVIYPAGSTPPPVTTKIVTTKPVTTKIVTTKPVTTKPVTTKPVTTTQIVTTEMPTTAVPTTEIPTTAAPTTPPVSSTAVLTTVSTTTTPTTTLSPPTAAPSSAQPVVTTTPVTQVPSGKSDSQNKNVRNIVLGGICFVLLTAEVAALAAMRKKKTTQKEDQK